ncbi:MAG: MBOAT family protein [Clostridiales bacterium]|jgi:alginate O-acetyltransferase complex protein AlgI|nr:MBOAT family protein [Clostridiales bacterium]
MVFSSLVFLYLFLPVCLVLYFVMPTLKAKNVVLCFLSLLFYAWGEPLWVVAMIFSALTDYTCSRIIGKHRGTRTAKLAMAASVILNLGLLFTFKYSDFFLGTVGALTTVQVPVVGLRLPIGISFYTFQTMSYTLDVYRDEMPVQHNFLDLLLFVSLFPQLIAGPIVRYREVAEQIGKRNSTWEGVSSGMTRFFCGLGKKVLLANFAGETARNILNSDFGILSAPAAWLGILCFAFQIYFDFSGYSDMAIGLGRVFGFRYGENFDHPYIARSITSFWRRWHISLGRFFRDYVYIPLGGNRRFQLRNIMIVWFLTGLWHGASWNFVIWGLYFGVLLVLEKHLLKRFLHKLKWGGILYSFFFVLLGWVLFYFTDLTRALAFCKILFAGGAPLDKATGILLINNLPLLLLCAVASTPVPKLLKQRLINWPAAARWRPAGTATAVAFNMAILFLCTSALVGASYNPFLYFRF